MCHECISNFRSVYHCPFCNLCRVGKGLGIDFFHCMTCNCCLGIKSVNHKCLEKGLETNCPICCDFLFTSSAPVRALPCGHYMHSSCFQVLYTLSCFQSMFLPFFFIYLDSCISERWLIFLLHLMFCRHILAVTILVQYAANPWEIWR